MSNQGVFRDLRIEEQKIKTQYEMVGNIVFVITEIWVKNKANNEFFIAGSKTYSTEKTKAELITQFEMKRDLAIAQNNAELAKLEEL